MTANPDYLDFTTAVSRLTAQLANSPVVSTTAGWNSVTLTLLGWERSLNLLVQNPSNVISLAITGVTTGFTYLSAMPALDSGIYYLPAMPVVDAQITVSWYQVTTTSVSIYVIASDEPIAVGIFNPVSPTLAYNENITGTVPVFCAANVTTTAAFNVNSTTDAVRCSVDVPANYVWGRVVGATSGNVYYDGSATNKPFPLTPIPIDRTVDSAVNVSVHTTVAGTVNLYISAVNTPDFSGNVPLTHPMAPNELAPDARSSNIPNQAPAIARGAIAASGDLVLFAATANVQIRLFGITIFNTSATATNVDLMDTTVTPYLRLETNQIFQLYKPLFGQLVARGRGIKLHNNGGVATGTISATLDYSVL